MSTRNLTIMFTDIKGFTERTARSSRDYVVKMLEKQDQIAKPIFAKYHGTIIKTIGDAYLVTFESPTNGVICGLMIQHALRNYNRSAGADEKIEVRVAINTGEVNIVGADIIGDPVNVASRVEGITEAGEVWFTEATYLAMNKQEVPTSIVGEFKLKGVPEAIRVYRGLVDETQILFKRDFPAGSKAGSAIGPAAAPFEPVAIERPKRTGIKVAVIGGVFAVIALILASAYVSIPYLQKDVAFENIQKLLASGKAPQAMQSLEPMLAQEPNSEYLQDLGRKGVEGEVRELIAAGRAPDAQSRFDYYQTKYTFLGAMSDLKRDIRAAQLAQYQKAGKDTFKDEQAFLADYIDDAEAHYAIAMLRVKYYGGVGLRSAWPALNKAVKLDKQIALRPDVKKAFSDALDELSYYELIERGDGAALYADLFLADTRAKLLANLYDAKSDSKRWVAHDILVQAKDTKDIQFTKFHTLNLLDESLSTHLQKKTLDFFESDFEKEHGNIAEPLPLFPMIFSSDETIAKRALALARTKFRASMEAALSSAQKSDDERQKEAAEKVLK